MNLVLERLDALSSPDAIPCAGGIVDDGAPQVDGVRGPSHHDAALAVAPAGGEAEAPQVGFDEAGHGQLREHRVAAVDQMDGFRNVAMDHADNIDRLERALR